MIAVTLLVAAILVPDEIDRLRGDALASLFYVNNWHLIFTHQSYFQSFGRPSLFRHLWSLSVEEQFYLLWPPVLCLLYRGRRSERVVAIVVAGAALAVAAHRWAIVPSIDWSRGWFGPDTQADALLAGCAVALGLRCRSRLAGQVALVGLVGLLGLAVDGSPFTMRWLVPATIACTAVLVPVLADHGGWLAWRPLRAIGRRSYGLYLWGTPISFLAYEVYGLRGLALLLVVFPATFAVSEATYRLVEVPLRRLGRRPAPPALRPRVVAA